MAQRKPSAYVRAWNEAVAITEKHAARLRAGVRESKPSDYAVFDRSEEGRRRLDARHRLEDKRIAKEAKALSDWNLDDLI